MNVMSPEDGLMVVALEIARAKRGPWAQPHDGDLREADVFLRSIATHPGLEAAILMRCSRTEAINRAQLMCWDVPREKVEALVDAVLMTEDPNALERPA